MKRHRVCHSVCFLLGVFLLVGCCAVATGSLTGDLNEDGQVDFSDARLLAEKWLYGSQYPQEGLLARWQFEESSGVYVFDSTPNEHTAELMGGAGRFNEGGIYDNVLLLDGVGDFVVAPYVLNPADGPLSVFAWVKGGDDREVILTQTNGTGVGREWLQIDTAGGKLVSRLTDGSAVKLGSDPDVVIDITDGEWHHVGVVWDGSRRYLYVDGDEVARDASPLGGELQFCDGQMYIGAGKTLADFTFWTGRIDNVCVYSRAVSAAEVELMAHPLDPGNADLDGNKHVDFGDFAIMARNWRVTGSGEYRCIWVDIWDPSVRTASQCDALVQLCRNNNINTVMPEIRAYGDAYYQSNLEPRSSRIPDGGFDPLGYLIDKAHDTSGGKKYIEVHAWFVMQRVSSTTTLDPQHVLSQHWEYVMRNSSGSAGTAYYLDPGHPGALDHNVAVILDCLSNYDIDGINLDYIRYPGSAWGYNQTSIDRFNAFYGKSGNPSSWDPDWSDWRRECVTHQVKKVYVMSLMIDPDVVITADTINWGSYYSESNYTSSSAYAGVFQDWAGWLREGIIDYNAFMNYVAGGSNTRYNGWTDLSLANDDKRGSIIGIGAYMQTSVQDAMDQLLYARDQGAAGLNIYDWGGEVNANTIGETANDFYRELKAQVCPEWVDPPVHMWKVRPTKGIFEGYVSASGAVDHAAVEIEGDPSTRVYTDGTGWYAILEIPPGEHVLRFSKPGYSDVVSAPTMLTAGQIKTVDADL